MATDPKKTEHVRDIAGTGERDSRPGEAFERAGQQARENIAQGGQTAERGTNAAREAVNQAGATAERASAEARTVAGQAGEVARDASGRAREAAERITEQTKETTEQAARQAREISENFADLLARTTDLAVNTTERAAEQGREAVWQGVRAAAGMQARLADVGYGRGHRLIGSSARMIELYREASENTAETVQALVKSYVHLGRGMQEMQRAYLDLLDRAVERSTRKPQDLLRCRSLEEFAGVQRDIYVDAVNHAVEATSTLLDLASRAAQDALEPLQNKGRFARA